MAVGAGAMRIRDTCRRACSLFPRARPGYPNRERISDEEESMTSLNSLNDVLEEQLVDLYSAEQQLIEALPKMAQAASTDELRQAFETHLQETKGHFQRLQDLLPTLGFQAGGETCEAMKGLIKEGEKVIQAQGDPLAKD